MEKHSTDGSFRRIKLTSGPRHLASPSNAPGGGHALYTCLLQQYSKATFGTPMVRVDHHNLTKNHLSCVLRLLSLLSSVSSL